MKHWIAAWRRVDGEDRVKLVITFILFLFQLPLMVVFYFFRSAWNDCARISLWLRAKHICEHGIDRVREHCEPCCLADADAEFSNVVHGHRN